MLVHDQQQHDCDNERQAHQARSSFRWFKIDRFVTFVCPSTSFFERILRRLWYKLYGNRKKSCVSFCGTIGSKRRSIKTHIMRLVQRRYSIECTRVIGLHRMLTIESHDVPKNLTHDFFLLPYNLYHSLRKIRSKNRLTDGHLL